jgi:Polyketide cyclase / dehydrase and lipid transport
MYIHLNDRITINASAKKVWRILAHDFGNIGQWASAIPASKAVAELPVPEGAEVGGRVCSTAVPGFSDIQESFMFYDEQSMSFAYQATEGRPWFLKQAENHWAVRSLGPNTSLVETWAETDISLFPGLFLAPLFKLQMGRIGTKSLEELKYYLEHDQPHPRKLKAQQKHVPKQVSKPI